MRDVFKNVDKVLSKRIVVMRIVLIKVPVVLDLREEMLEQPGVVS